MRPAALKFRSVDDVVLQDRNVKFQEAFLHIVLAGKLGEVSRLKHAGSRPAAADRAGLRCCSSRSSKPSATAILPAGRPQGSVPEVETENTDWPIR